MPHATQTSFDTYCANLVRIHTKSTGNCGWLTLAYHLVETLVFNEHELYAQAKAKPVTYATLIISILEAQVGHPLFNHNNSIAHGNALHLASEEQTLFTLKKLKLYISIGNYDDIIKELALAMRIFHYRQDIYQHESQEKPLNQSSLPINMQQATWFVNEKKLSLLEKDFMRVEKARHALKAYQKSLSQTPSGEEVEHLHTLTQSLKTSIAERADLHAFKNQQRPRSPIESSSATTHHVNRLLDHAYDLVLASIQNEEDKKHFIWLEDANHDVNMQKHIVETAVSDHQMAQSSSKLWTSDKDLKQVTTALGFTPSIQYSKQFFTEKASSFPYEQELQHGKEQLKQTISKRNVWLFCFSPSANSVRSRHIRGGRYEHGAHAYNHWEPLALKKHASALHAHHPECSFDPFKEKNGLSAYLHRALQYLIKGHHGMVRLIKKMLRKLKIKFLSDSKGNTWLIKKKPYRTTPTQVEPSLASSLRLERAAKTKPHNVLDDTHHYINTSLVDQNPASDVPNITGQAVVGSLRMS